MKTIKSEPKPGVNANRITLANAILVLQTVARWQEECEAEESVKHFRTQSTSKKE